MGSPINGILTEKGVIRIPGVESHLTILDMSGIDDTDLVPDFVKWGLTPPKSGELDMWFDWREWSIIYNQDQFPEWWAPEADSKRIRDWAKRHARVEHNKTHVTGAVDLLAGRINELVGPVSVAYCAPGTVILHAGHAIIGNAGDARIMNAGYSTIMDAQGATIKTAWKATIRRALPGRVGK